MGEPKHRPIRRRPQQSHHLRRIRWCNIRRLTHHCRTKVPTLPRRHPRERPEQLRALRFHDLILQHYLRLMADADPSTQLLWIGHRDPRLRPRR